MIALVTLIWRCRQLLFRSTQNEIRSRYAGSALGLVWLLIYPLLFLVTYALVFIFIYKVRFHLFNANEYVVVIFCGLIPFIGFSESISSGIGSVSANANLIKNTMFPIELIPIRSVLSSQATQVVGTIILLISVAIVGKLTLLAGFIPLVWIFQLLFTIGFVWILSSIQTIIKDLNYMISIAILILMMISPIAYSEDMVPDGIRPFLKLNPMYYFIVANQDCLMLGRLPP